MSFEGFRPELLEFLSGLKPNNNREWFQEHRDDYDLWFWQGDGAQPRAAGVFLSADARKPDTWRRHARVLRRTVGALQTGGSRATEAVFTGDLPNMCVRQFKRVAPLQQWLVDLLAD